jgi:clan AA aspartic protease (TIGR02281 family)
VYFDDNRFLPFKRKEGHFYVDISVVCEGGTGEESVPFIVDTGAFITVVSRKTAIAYGYDLLDKIPSAITGFSGSAQADLVRIPALWVVGRLLTNVLALIPVDPSLSSEVLGLNVLEYFCYYIDTTNDRIYFKDNPNPRFYDSALKVGSIFNIEQNTKKSDSNVLKLMDAF